MKTDLTAKLIIFRETSTEITEKSSSPRLKGAPPPRQQRLSSGGCVSATPCRAQKGVRPLRLYGFNFWRWGGLQHARCVSAVSQPSPPPRLFRAQSPRLRVPPASSPPRLVLSAAPRPRCRASKALPLRGSSVCLRVVASPRAVPALSPDSSDGSDSSDAASLTRPLGCVAFLVVRRALAKPLRLCRAQKRPKARPKAPPTAFPVCKITPIPRAPFSSHSKFHIQHSPFSLLTPLNVMR